jgi:uncharacterized protein (DUF1015 family)
VTRSEPDETVTDDDGVRHRLWVVPAGARGDGGPVDRLITVAEAAPIVIADGHHRYTTALAYRQERGVRRACTEDPPYETILALLIDLAANELTILPTHRVVDGDPHGETLLDRLAAAFEVEVLASGESLVAAFGSEVVAPGRSSVRIGLWTDDRAAVLRPRPGALDATLARTASPATRMLAVSILEAALLEVYGLDGEAVAGGGRITYVKGAQEAIAAAGGLAASGRGGAAYLLDPTSADDVLRVARAGELMPQKSTYFSPKPATGLLFAPGEW